MKEEGRREKGEFDGDKIPIQYQYFIYHEIHVPFKGWGRVFGTCHEARWFELSCPVYSELIYFIYFCANRSGVRVAR